MADFRLSLPDSASEFILQKIEAGVFQTPSEVVVALVEDARRRESLESLRAELQKGDRSPSIELTEEWLQDRRRELLSRLPMELRE